MTVWLAILLGNFTYFGIFIPLEIWRATRRERLNTLRRVGPACERAGWHPVAFRWRGRLRNRPEFEMRHDDGRQGFARVDG